ncbi:uncharacterized protein LOC128854024 [Cuculus canorus]|uniref:uncharacterized protein LOC128854024 n=1 Tax=Cuculus canorus TaxID=55661 RepID=UPI0023AAE4E1|nr:uncharacterized protein LOC128854024 [Cuculus canorus]
MRICNCLSQGTDKREMNSARSKYRDALVPGQWFMSISKGGALTRWDHRLEAETWEVEKTGKDGAESEEMNLNLRLFQGPARGCSIPACCCQADGAPQPTCFRITFSLKSSRKLKGPWLLLVLPLPDGCVREKAFMRRGTESCTAWKKGRTSAEKLALALLSPAPSPGTWKTQPAPALSHHPNAHEEAVPYTRMQPNWPDITKEHKDIPGTASTLHEASYEAHQPAAHQELLMPVAKWSGLRTSLAVPIIAWSNQNHSVMEGDRITACLFPSTTSHPSHNGDSDFLCMTDYSVAPREPLVYFGLAKYDQFCGWIKKFNSLYNQTCLASCFPYSSVSPGDTRRSSGRRGL